MANWKIGEAKQRLSEVVRASGKAPQRIFNRNRLVAAVVSPQDLEALRRYRQASSMSLADLFAEAATLAAAERPGEAPYRLDVPSREDRVNPLFEVFDSRE